MCVMEKGSLAPLFFGTVPAIILKTLRMKCGA